MSDDLRSIEEIEKHLATTPGLTGGEPQRILRELCKHLVRQQKEIDDLRKGGASGGTSIVRDPDGTIRL